MRYKIKINDRVSIIAGKDKGKSGKVIQVLPAMNKIVVEGINVMYKHLRSPKRGEKGQRVQFNGPVAISNIMLNCPKCNKATRVGIKESDRQAKTRFCKKCKELID
ncbi:MAG: 50S ribosomal protein L24 [Candidatus Komeilibacteria bacterium CG11_big_fil_rev_8_21_14_0_20_36_20]|uniref:Large ribosomal subunit protein uL24 n=1 Tax=Candidatus Komeilibacteria bacterium CG11_big_fil_rev_8_21_14_0_20_36_20 TaxID=1974477 RepID=A0A2H0NDS9_9BACT|nr:MAG: 50S ribosomal protein L24 [Candidatus Komeilibacteria bacterium CG11_big_fil_rev_8_21_14_0_20_36_20]PIR81395.1 MAG: 50S ribosomal protein L24 [Candidatus Komeilibacteria bacterium CG10_big_fil_rev_8_21_14_0_10_36_65]PJC55120.1 MAG: 50S ribosomal protein L24 [Candidatus Komeilibacteria bacterium CG_4_9_14_0_2_um_filter_36_13]